MKSCNNIKIEWQSFEVVKTKSPREFWERIPPDRLMQKTVSQPLRPWEKWKIVHLRTAPAAAVTESTPTCDPVLGTWSERDVYWNPVLVGVFCCSWVLPNLSWVFPWLLLSLFLSVSYAPRECLNGFKFIISTEHTVQQDSPVMLPLRP